MNNQKVIYTPRGNFKVEEYAIHSWKKEEEIKKEGYGYWFSKLLMVDGLRIEERIFIKQGKLPIKYKVLKMVEELN